MLKYFIFLLRVRSISKAWLDTYSRPSAAAANGIICRPGRLKFLSFGGKPQSDSELRTEEILIWGSPRMEKNKFPMNHEFLFPTSWFSRHSENKSPTTSGNIAMSDEWGILPILLRSNNFWIKFHNFSHSVQSHNRSPKAGLSSVVWYGEISPFPSGSGGDLAPQIRGSSENLSHSLMQSDPIWSKLIQF